MRKHRPIALGGLAIAMLVVGLTGCANPARMDAEMRQQELDMKSDLISWTSDAETWISENARMQAELQAMPAKAGSEVEAEIMNHAAWHHEHARNIEEFASTLSSHQKDVDEESDRPEDERVLAHSGLWAKHLIVRASHASLAMTHKSLMDKHAELLAKSSVTK